MDKLTSFIKQQEQLQQKFEKIANPFQELIDSNQRLINFANAQNNIAASLTQFSDSLSVFKQPSTALINSFQINNLIESLNSCIHSNGQLTNLVPLVRNDFTQTQYHLDSLFNSVNQLTETISNAKIFEDIVNQTTELNSCFLELSKKYQYNIPKGFSDIVFKDDYVEVPTETLEDLSLETSDTSALTSSSQETSKASKSQIISWNDFIKIFLPILLTFLLRLAGDYINSEFISKSDKETSQYIINYTQEISNYFLNNSHNALEDNQDDQSPVEPHSDEYGDLDLLPAEELKAEN